MSRPKTMVVSLAVGLALAAGAGLRGPASADEATTPTAQEGWYSVSPTCALPAGCTPVAPPSRYPAGTLHVGVTGGLEDSRTYLKLEFSGVPSNAVVTGATLRLPVAPSADGSASPATAALVACPANAAFAPAEGSTASPPAVDCAAPLKATFVAGPPAMFTVDINDLVRTWTAGGLNNGIAILPAPGTAPGTNWHVAFSARARQGSDVPPISAIVSYDADSPIVELPAPEPSRPVTEFVPGPLPAPFSEPVFSLNFPPPASPAAAVVAQSELPDFQPVAEVVGPGFAYPVVMILPLLLLGLGGYLAWALTKPVGAAHP